MLSAQSPQVEHLRTRLRARRELPSAAARRAIRLAAGATLHDVADAIGASPQAVHNWERGLRQPSARFLTAYAAVLAELRRLA